MKNFKGICINIGLMLASIVFVLVATEVLLRFFFPFCSETRQVQFAHEYYIYDADLGYDIKENVPEILFIGAGFKQKKWSNELGCFDYLYRGEKDYVLLTGDSFAWGYAPFEETCGRLIEKYLGYRVLKCGVPGYGTMQERIKAGKIMEKVGVPPKLIIVGYYVGNDSFNDFCEYSRKNHQEGLRLDWYKKMSDLNKGSPDRRNPIFLKVKNYLSMNSVLYIFISQNRYVRAIGEKFGLCKEITPEYMFYSIKKFPFLSQAWEINADNLRGMKELAAKAGARLLVVLIPAKMQVYDFLKLHGDYDWTYPNNRLRGFFARERIEYLDLLPLLRKYANEKPGIFGPSADLYWEHDGHWNKNGNALAAILISEYIISHKFLDVDESREKLKQLDHALAKFKARN
jgi:hypothetical protein